MSDRILDRRELDFQLYEVLDTEALCRRERFREHSRETFDATLEMARRMATELFAPHNRKVDRDEPRFLKGRVSMPAEVGEAVRAFADAGFIAGRMDFDLGGMQLPEVIMNAALGWFTAANPSTAGYPFLTIAAANLINAFADEEIRARFLGPMLRGRFTGTMALTEPQAGSSLADITTSATPQEDGSYHLKGNKIFISAGDHELAENIVHLVLAKLPDAPPGTKGISLFAVPRYRVDADGRIGEHNNVTLTGLIHKLGYRGTTSTMLAFGEDGPCQGFLLGRPHEGLKCMFHMMNEARLGVGYGAAVIGYRGYLYSLDYARERPQGRLPSSPDPLGAPVNIVEHADVRRMLLAQKAWTEGAICLCMYGASLIDDAATHPDEQYREEARLLLELLTPVIKAWPSDYGVRANDLAIQVLGGAGYTRDHPVEQFWRDNRLNPIHEGTNGIQAIDLLGRKVWQSKGRGLRLLRERIIADMDAAPEECQELVLALQKPLAWIERSFAVLAQAMQMEGPDRTLANAHAFLHLVGHTVVGWMWLRQAGVAARRLAGVSEAERPFYHGKIQAARWFARWELPLLERDALVLQGLDDSSLEMKPEWF